MRFLMSYIFWGFGLLRFLMYIYLLRLLSSKILIYIYLMMLLSYEVFWVHAYSKVFIFWHFWCTCTFRGFFLLRFFIHLYYLRLLFIFDYFDVLVLFEAFIPSKVFWCTDTLLDVLLLRFLHLTRLYEAFAF